MTKPLEKSRIKTKQSAFWHGVWHITWPPIMVLLLHVGLAAIIGHRVEFDPLFHLLGGMAGALTLGRTADAFSQFHALFSVRNRSLTTIGGMIAAIFVWELGEFLSDRFFGTHTQSGFQDTGLDVLLGLLGTVGIVVIANLLTTREARKNVA